MACFSLLHTLCWAVNYCFIASVRLSSYGRLQEVAKQDVCDSNFSSSYQTAKCMCNSIRTQLKPRTNTIHLIPKWRPINYSFVCLLISLFRFVSMYKKQEFCSENEAQRANEHANKKRIYWPPF